MNLTEAVIRREARRQGLIALSMNVRCAPEPEELDRLWWFFANGKPIEGFQGICEPELMEFFDVWNFLTEQELEMINKELYEIS